MAHALQPLLFLSVEPLPSVASHRGLMNLSISNLSKTYGDGSMNARC